MLIVVVIAVGCSTIPATQANQSIATPSFVRATTRMPRATPPQHWLNWSRRWLKQIPCSAHCWENITPHQTTVREAIKILQSSPIIVSDSVQIIRELCGDSNSPETAYSRRLVWEWTYASYNEGGIINYAQQPPANAIPECWADFLTNETISPDETTLASPIDRIELEFLHATPDAYNLAFRPTLGDVINAYGQPSHIVAVEKPEFSSYFVNIIYESRGLVLKKEDSWPIKLDETTDFWQAIFSDDPISEGIGYFDDKTLVPWQGIRDFAFYCRYENGLPCN